MGETAQARTVLLLAWLVLALLAWPAAAQGPDRRVALEQVDLWVAPAVDLERVFAEDIVRSEQALPPRIGLPLVTDLSPANSGTWETRSDGSRLWRLRVRSEGAQWLVLGFDRFRIPAGARLRVYDPTGATESGPFTHEDVRAHGELWVPPVEAETLVVELVWPASEQTTEPDLHLGTVSHGYKSWRFPERWEDLEAGNVTAGVGSSGACHIDVTCPEGQGWEDQTRGVVKLIVGGSALCSGTLINNSSQDCRPLVLSADHCFVGLPPASTLFYFNFELSTCAGGSVPPNQVVIGASAVSRSAVSDFILLEMDSDPPASFDAFFAGWDRSGIPAAEVTTIHHPSGDVKKISYSDDALFTSSELPSHWRVDNWESGSTESGSSGSAIFDPNGRIVGQLDGGNAGCLGSVPNSGYDEYGKFHVSWTGESSSSTRLSDALDPTATGAVTLNGLDASFCDALAPRLELAGVVTDDSEGNFDGVLDPGDIARLEVWLKNVGPMTATGVTATLTSTDAMVTMLDEQADWPNVPPRQSRNSSLPHFRIDVDPAHTCGLVVPFHLDITSAEGAWDADFAISLGVPGTPSPIFQDDFEPPPLEGWTTAVLTGATPWILTTNKDDSYWAVGDSFGLTDSTLTLPDLPAFSSLPVNTTVRFEHVMVSETGWDGGVLEYSTDPGHTVWQDAAGLFTSGGYNGSITVDSAATLAGRAAWTGDLGGPQTVELDLRTLAGQPFSLRWRFATDVAGNLQPGWQVDDVVVETAGAVCAAPESRLYPGARCRGLRPGQTPGKICGKARPGGPRAPRTPRSGR